MIRYSYIVDKKTIFDIADLFIFLGGKGNKKKYVTNLKLQKLLYFAQATYLAKFGRALFSDDIVAWQYGPVVEAVYNKYKKYDNQPIPIPSEFAEQTIPEDINLFVRSIWKSYGNYSANELIALSHKHSPWIVAYNSGKGTILSLESIKDFYNKKILPTKEKYTVVDLFAGVGGFYSGLIQTNRFDLKLSTDFDKYCEEFHKVNHPDLPFLKMDIKKLDENELKRIGIKEVDVLIGGPPCQGFSTIGNRASPDEKKRMKFDPRNNLIGHYIRVLKILKPKYFVMENVKGLLTYRKGEFFKEILKEFEGLNYNINFKILNAADFGVPQIRKRVFVYGNRVGYKNDEGPVPSHDEKGINGKKYTTVLEAIGDLAGKENKVFNHVPLKHKSTNIRRYKFIPEGGRMPEHKLPPELYRKNFGNTFKRLHRFEPSLTMVPGHNAFPIHPWLHRSLTVREAARIMTYKDNVKFVGPRHMQCIQVGNSVPPLMGKAWADHITNVLDNYL